ncbi:MAG: hypothetical protein HYX80_03705 [Chloroflexi bacterium]|nr:hypothetical protein [Chloroflexota bacterium]
MNPWLIALIVVLLAAFAAVTIIWGIRAHRLKVTAGVEELIGKTAEVRNALNPKGSVFIEGELWTAVSEAGNIESGEQAVITKVDGLTLYVAKKSK